MAAKDLITSARAAQEIYGYPLGAYGASGGSDPTGVLGVLITACSDLIEKYCRRRFVSASYDELYNGEGDKRLLLREYPVQKVDSVRYRPVTVLKIQNADTATNQRATAAITNSGITLTRAASGVKTTDTTTTWASFPTLQECVANIAGLGNGWTAQVVGQSNGDYGLWPSADLYVPGSYGDPLEGTGIQQSQGALTCRGSWAELKLHTYELQGYQWDARGWLLRAIPYTDPELLHPEDLIWPMGINNFRVQYTAGYSTVPEAVQDACALLVSIRYQETLRDPSLTSQVSSTSSLGWQNLFPSQGGGLLPNKVSAMLEPYVRRSVSTNQG